MKSALTIVLLAALLIDPTKIGKINKAKAEAKKLFNDGHYKEAVLKYHYLIDSMDVSEDELKLNLAHAYYLAKDTANAKPVYQQLTQSQKNEIRSKALQQLGIMNNSQGKSEEALNQFKQAIIADASNQDARYNYEMLKKKLDERKKQEQNQQNKDQNKKDQNKDQKEQQNQDKQNKETQNKEDQKNKEQQNKNQEEQQKKEQEQKDKKEQEQKDQQKKDEQSQEEKDKERAAKEKKEQQDKKGDAEEKQEAQRKKENQKVPEDVAKKLEKMNISEEKAQMLLEAMKNQEVQYLQQNKRKATKPKDKGKPDW